MKVYRVEFFSDPGMSAGFRFVSSKREAERLRREADDNRTDDDKAAGECAASVAVFDVKPTKAGILRALNLLAAHPNNG